MQPSRPPYSSLQNDCLLQPTETNDQNLLLLQSTIHRHSPMFCKCSITITSAKAQEIFRNSPAYYWLSLCVYMWVYTFISLWRSPNAEVTFDPKHSFRFHINRILLWNKSSAEAVSFIYSKPIKTAYSIRFHSRIHPLKHLASRIQKLCCAHSWRPVDQGELLLRISRCWLLVLLRTQSS